MRYHNILNKMPLSIHSHTKPFHILILTHWGQVTHICISKLTIIGSDNGLPPDRRQAIIWTNAGILLIGPLGTNFSVISIEILTFSFKKMRLKVSSAKQRPFCLGLNVLTQWGLATTCIHQSTGSSMVQEMAWHLLGTKPLPIPMLTSRPFKLNSFINKFTSTLHNFLTGKCIWKCCLQNVIHFVPASMCQTPVKCAAPAFNFP